MKAMLKGHRKAAAVFLTSDHFILSEASLTLWPDPNMSWLQGLGLESFGSIFIKFMGQKMTIEAFK